ncbi:hypothetical protein ILUMI_02378 [Ignelater luminosus]|uniref:Uncharacterized protein n=1 Tax=Ignelater luminosus TaxID=2038154 RepID=A0A8K0DI94_IGNLU|nr:hypothetical protein ILUMI_02378 [Ignelater luminosus]
MICERGAGLNNSQTKLTDERCMDFITEVAPPLSETIISVTWRGNVYNEVQHFFTTVLNSDGICYSFNLLDRNDLFSEEGIKYKNLFWNGNSSNWNIEEGFKDNRKHYPRSSSVSGVAGGIDFVFRASDNDIDYECTPDFVGFKVTIQHPALFPRGRKHFITVPLDQIVLGSIKPIMMKTSKKLRIYPPTKRQCYFISEKSLKFFKTYNQPNCLLECLANATFDSCGCVALHMPRDNSTPVCGSGSSRCMEKAQGLLHF